MNHRQPDPPMHCEAAGNLLVLYLCDELSAAERAALEAHLAACAACVEALARFVGCDPVRLRDLLLASAANGG